MICIAFLKSVRPIVNVRSVNPVTETFWTMTSTTMFASDSGLKIFAAIPGRSGTLTTVIFASLLLYATPDTTAVSMISSSVVTIVPGLSLNEERTWIRTPYFIPNSTERICSTLAPREASSSISSKEILSSLRASAQMFGSVV